MPETRQEPSRNDKNPLKLWAIQKNRACGASPSTQFGGIGAILTRDTASGSEFEREGGPVGGPQTLHCRHISHVFELADSAIIITTSCTCMWHAVLQLHQLLYRHMTLYIIPERTGLTPCRYYAAAVQCHAIRGSLKDFGRRRRPKCDARLAQKAQKWGLARRRREIFGDMGYILGIFF